MFNVDNDIQTIITKMIESNNYSLIIWAGGDKTADRHSHSDVDLYAVSKNELSNYRYMEKLDETRIELTVYTYEKWLSILAKPYKHPKHHYTFASGKLVYDSDSLHNQLKNTAMSTLNNWPRLLEAELEALKNDIVIQYDKMLGRTEKRQPGYSRIHHTGLICSICDYIIKSEQGFSIDATKNIEYVLNQSNCSENLKTKLKIALTDNCYTTAVEFAADFYLTCCEEINLDIKQWHGGIPT